MSIAMQAAARMEQDGDSDATELLAALREEGADVETLLLRLVRAAQEAAANAEAVKARAAALAARKARYEAQETNCRQAIAGIMDALGLAKWKHAEASVSLTAGRPGVVVSDVSLLPGELCRVEVKPLTAEIKRRLEAGEVIPGAALANGMPQLSIRSA